MENKDLIPVELFCTHYNIEISFIHSLTEFGLVEIDTIEDVYYISKEKISDIERLIRFHYELNINMEGIDAISHLLQKMDTLQQEIRLLKNRLGLYE